MRIERKLVLALTVVIGSLTAVGTAQAQRLGTFRWQQEPYCNVITLSVEQSGGVYQLTGTTTSAVLPPGAPSPVAPSRIWTARLAWDSPS